MSDLQQLTLAMRNFTEERDWGRRFHDPKSLLVALVGEVGEVAELVQWLPADEAAHRLRQPDLHATVADELADVLLYLLRLADVLEVDLAAAAGDKLRRNAERFPRDEVRGQAPERG